MVAIGNITYFSARGAVIVVAMGNVTIISVLEGQL